MEPVIITKSLLSCHQAAHPCAPPAGFAATAAIMRVLDIYAGPVEAHTALTKAAALPLTILRSNFQLMSDDSVDMSALASRIRRTQDLQEQRQALRQAPSFRRGGAGAAELDEFQARGHGWMSNGMGG